MLKRMWINSPSRLQPEYKMHARNVLVDLSSTTDRFVDVYFVDGPVVSQRMDRLYLSAGWVPQARQPKWDF